MDYDLSPPQKLLQEAARTFVARECPLTRVRQVVDGGALDADACDKVVSFIVLCDSFNVPLVMLVDYGLPGPMLTRQALPHQFGFRSVQLGAPSASPVPTIG